MTCAVQTRPYNRHRHVAICEKKHPYATEEEAWRYAVAVGGPGYYYPCAICDLWHLTRRPPDLRQNDFLRMMERHWREENGQ